MTRRKLPYDLQKVTLNLRRGDFEWLRVIHGRDGASKVIRDMVQAHVDRVRNKAQLTFNFMERPDV